MVGKKNVKTMYLNKAKEDDKPKDGCRACV